MSRGGWIVDANGEQCSYSTAAVATDLLADVPLGGAVVDTAPPSSTAYWDVGAWHTRPEQPINADEWDAENKHWIDTRTLTTAKIQRVAQMRDARDAAINGSFIWDGSTFDADQVSQTRIMGLKVASADAGFTAKAWRLADNSWRVLSAADAAGVWAALEAHVSGHFTTFAGLDAAIQAATTVAAVDQVIWP